MSIPQPLNLEDTDSGVGWLWPNQDRVCKGKKLEAKEEGWQGLSTSLSWIRR
jgi:hypothetical protein